jgi:hypothetical protein
VKNASPLSPGLTLRNLGQLLRGYQPEHARLNAMREIPDTLPILDRPKTRELGLDGPDIGVRVGAGKIHFLSPDVHRVQNGGHPCSYTLFQVLNGVDVDGLTPNVMTDGIAGPVVIRHLKPQLNLMGQWSYAGSLCHVT